MQSSFKTVTPLSRIKFSSKEELNKKVIMFLYMFIAINSLKITLYNFFIMPDKNLLSFILKFVLSFMLLYLVYFLMVKAKSRAVFLIFFIIQGIYIFANLAYYDYFHNYLHLFQAAALFTEGVGSIKHFSIPVNPKDLIIFIDVPLFIILLKHYKDLTSLSKNPFKYKKYFIAGLILLILGIESIGYFFNASTLQLTKDYTEGESSIVSRYGIIVNSVFDIALNRGGKSYISHLQLGKDISNDPAVYKDKDKPNIVVIQVESLDANVINKTYNGKLIAPKLNSLARKNVYYPYTLSYHKAGGTSDSEFAIINSVEPLTNFPSIKLSSYTYPNSMIKVLNDNSYSTIAFHGNIGNYYNRDVAFNKMGFNEFHDIRTMGYQNTGWGAPDGNVFNYQLNVLKNIKEPFLSYTITMTSHTPFTNAKNYYNNSSYDSIENERVKNYFNSISYVDESIYNFVTRIRNEYKNSYIFIIGDHTPEVNYDEYHQASFTIEEDYFEFVPLIIITPDNKRYTETNEVASFIDIAPTILYATNSSFTYKSDGANLLDFKEVRGDIPFKGSMYNRADLYKMISKVK